MFTKTLITVTAVGGVLLGATPALAGDAGLYGTADPTFDGVYRQSLSILALNASDQKVPASAVRWLKKQQCSDGGFMAYRADASVACQAPDPINYAGQDSNSTALAAVALLETGNKAQARKAAKWLAEHQGADGGWAYYPAAGSTSDTNSTALAIGSLTAVRGPQQATYLRSVQQRCSTAQKNMRGGLAFDTSFPRSTTTPPARRPGSSAADSPFLLLGRSQALHPSCHARAQRRTRRPPSRQLWAT